MATWRNKQKLAAVSKETQEYPRNSQSQNTSAAGITEEYIAHVSEEIEGRVTKKCPKNSAGQSPESWVLCSNWTNFSWTHGYGQSPEPFREHSGIVPGTFWNADVENQEPSGDRSQNDPHPEVEFSACRASSLTDSDPDETSHSTHHYFSAGFRARRCLFCGTGN